MQQPQTRPDKYLCTNTSEEILAMQSQNIDAEYQMIADAGAIPTLNHVVEEYQEKWDGIEDFLTLHPVHLSTFTANRRHAITTNDAARRIQSFFNPGAYTALHHSNQSPRKQN
jgi:hypothetical protein